MGRDSDNGFHVDKRAVSKAFSLLILLDLTTRERDDRPVPRRLRKRVNVPSERVQRQIERLLDEAADAISHDDWATVRQRAHAALTFDSSNEDALSYLAAAEEALAVSEAPKSSEVSSTPLGPTAPQPTSFANGRYTVTKFLGEGARRRSTLREIACSIAMWRSH